LEAEREEARSSLGSESLYYYITTRPFCLAASRTLTGTPGVRRAGRWSNGSVVFILRNMPLLHGNSTPLLIVAITRATTTTTRRGKRLAHVNVVGLGTVVAD